MMDTQVHINKILLPLSWLYGIVVWIRNKFFDWGILKSIEYPVPVISIGNIAVGGTGKTPHTEYLIRLLQKDYRVAVLSRGYKRKTSGFILADENATARTIGDEPYQMWKKFPEILVAVDKKRTRGIRNLMELPANKRPEIILLDDAYQHRHVIPSLSIVLTDSHRLYYEDYLLPAGRLREPAGNISRAGMVIVTKCPDDFKPIDYRVITKYLNLYPYQSLFFTSIVYRDICPVFNQESMPEISLEKIKDEKISVLLIAGIADPQPLIDMLTGFTPQLEKMIYPDHYAFTSKDLAKINATYEQMPGNRKVILTTEKDAMRLSLLTNWNEPLKNALYFLPVEVAFNLKETEDFKQKINNHVRTIKRNRFMD